MLRDELELVNNRDTSDNNRISTYFLLGRLGATSFFHWAPKFHCFASLDNDRKFLRSRTWLSLSLPITPQSFKCSDRSLDPVAVSALLHGFDQPVWTRIFLGVLAGGDSPQGLYRAGCSKLEIGHHFLDARLSDCST